jgi:HEAT repeat protein
MMTMLEVRRAIDPEEPDYQRAAAELGREALPILAQLARSDDVMLASKAVSLAGVIGGDDALPIVEAAAYAEAAEVRIVAAVAAGRLGGHGEAVLVRLLDDSDVGVRRYAVRSVPEKASARIRAALERMGTSDPNPTLRHHVQKTLSSTKE